MKRHIKLTARPSLILLAAILWFSSCRSSRELIYMNDVTDQQTITSLADTITEYKIKPGDNLYVSIKSMNAEINTLFNPESNMQSQSSSSSQGYTTPQEAYLYGYEVNERGFITLPVLGDIPVAGQILCKIEDTVQILADQYVKDAMVKVKMLNYKVTVMGEVKNPGIYYSYDKNFTVIEALAMANGNTDYASIENVTVIRQYPDGEKAILLNLTSQESWLSEGFYLHPNDYVFVEPSKYKFFQLNSQAYSMFISSISVLLLVLAFILK